MDSPNAELPLRAPGNPRTPGFVSARTTLGRDTGGQAPRTGTSTFRFRA